MQGCAELCDPGSRMLFPRAGPAEIVVGAEAVRGEMLRTTSLLEARYKLCISCWSVLAV